MQETLSPEIFKQLGFGASMGFLIGFTFKRIFKLALFVVGVYIISLVWLADLGLISVNWEKLASSVNTIFLSFDSFIKTLFKTLSFGGSFIIGFALGMKV